ncbi:L10-interacting MYB domain-containing protein-like isoform X3 [Ananas comosus]|nr:L10-interacting MYB domain-containing protein-like isoform X3 [Ananas comosus]
MKMSPLQMELSDAYGRRIKATWDAVSTRVFCDICVEEVIAGNRPNTHFNKTGWVNVVGKFQERAKRNYDYKQLKNKWDSLKRDWVLWKLLVRNEKRVEWDYERGTIDANMEWCDEKLKVFPDAAKFRGGDLENMKQLDIMFSNALPSGETTMTPAFNTMLPAPIVDESNEDQIEGSSDSVDDVDFANINADNVTIASYVTPIREFPGEGRVKRKKRTFDVREEANEKRGRRRKAKLGNAVYMHKELERIRNAVESYNSQATCSVTSRKTDYPGCGIMECMGLLETIPEVEIGGELYMLGTRLFIKRDYREMFVALKRPDVQLLWLKQELETEARSR